MYTQPAGELRAAKVTCIVHRSLVQCTGSVQVTGTVHRQCTVHWYSAQAVHRSLVQLTGSAQVTGTLHRQCTGHWYSAQAGRCVMDLTKTSTYDFMLY